MGGGQEEAGPGGGGAGGAPAGVNGPTAGAEGGAAKGGHGGGGRYGVAGGNGIHPASAAERGELLGTPRRRKRSVAVVEQQGVSMATSTFTLITTIVGGGVLSLPFTIGCLGLIPGPVLLAFLAWLNSFSLGLLVKAAHRAGMVDKGSLEDLAAVAFGNRWRHLTAGTVIALTFFASVAYLLLIQQLISPVLSLLTCRNFGRGQGVETILLVAAAVMPFSCKQSMASMRFASYASVLSITMLLAILTYRSAQCLAGFLPAEGPEASKYYWCQLKRSAETHVTFAPVEVVEALISMPVVFGAFMCHFNVLPMHAELQKPTYDRMMRVINMTMGSVACAYVGVGVVGYLPLGREVCDNILLNYSSNDPLVNVGRLALASTLFLSYPLLVLPCRQTVARLVLLATAPAARARDSGGVDETAPLLEPSSPRVEVVAIPARPDASGGGWDLEGRTASRIGLSVFLVAMAALLATTTDRVTVIWSFMGSTVVCFVAFTLPGTVYLKLCKPVTFRERLPSYCLVAGSLVIMVMCVVASVINAFKKGGGNSLVTTVDYDPCLGRPFGTEESRTCLWH